MKDREERMEREDSFHSITSSSSDLSSIPSLSNASLGRPLCEYEEFCSPSWRSWASDESGPLSRTSSHSPLDAHDALLKELHELLEVKEKLLDVWIIVNNKYLTDEAWSWLRRVDNMVVIVNKSRQRRKSSLLFPWRRNIDVLKLRESITALSREGENFIHAFSNTFSNMFNNVIDHEDTLSQSIFVGHEYIISGLEDLLGSEGSNIIGITGPRGIGKTRILQEFLMLNEKTISRIRFDAVFLTTLPHEKPISAFQDGIAERINLSLRDYNREEHRRMVLYNALSDMKFLLVLDDLRSVLDLEAIGIPLPTRESMSKIVVTSRSDEVCLGMGVDVVIHVPTLSDEQSWELFRNLIRYEATADAEMKEWGKGLVRKFSGLPSAIISMAWGIDESMENISMEDSGGSIEEWSSQFKYSELLSEYWQDHVTFREQRWLWIGHTQALTSPIKCRLRTEFCSPSWRSDATWASKESGTLSRNSSRSPLDADALQKELLEVRVKLLDVWIIVNNKDLTDKALSWLRRVDKMIFIVNKLRQRRNASLLFSRWQLRELITALSREGRIFIHAFSNTFSNMFNNVIDHEGTLSQRTFVGHEDTLSQLGALLGSEESNIICITGPSGIGKTRILQEFLMLNEKSSSRIRFDAVFLTTLHHEKPISAFQDSIAEQINLSLTDYKREEQLRVKLYNALSDMKFLLVLDDLRSVLDLKAIGIPRPTTGRMSKIILTSRSAEVCTRMRVDMGIPVLALSDEQSWELFRNLIRYDTEDAEVEELKRDLVMNCCGLPSAIIRLARGINESMEGSDWSTEELSMEGSDWSTEELSMEGSDWSTEELSIEGGEYEELRTRLVARLSPVSV